MGVLRPRVFVSYSRKNEELVRQVRADLFGSEVDCWIDASDILAGQRLSPAIEAAINESDLFFAYVTQDFLRSRWCMAEIRYALRLPGACLAPYVDSQDTLDSVPSELLDEVAFGRLGPDNYVRSVLEISGRAWSSLQETRRLVPAEDHILASSRASRTSGRCWRSWMTSSFRRTGLPASSTSRSTHLASTRRSTTECCS
ncbi:MAG TPA: toll/interleukin-1 receptor domain-containing protein [Trebonia sp.]|nr:toll/interleukin-1 receptor domain-containing protein [Trebonia sp.]